MDGKIFIDWKPYDHPQLGKVEIGGFIGKLYNPAFKTYTNLMCNPGPVYEDFLVKHTKWNLYLASMTPWVRLTDVTVTPGESGYFKVTAKIQNQGFLPTNVTRQAIKNQMAKTVKAVISLNDAELAAGKETIDLGHLPGNTPREASETHTVEWMVKSTGGSPKATVKVVSEKGGTDSKQLDLK
jgi:hypothetical protein